MIKMPSKKTKTNVSDTEVEISNVLLSKSEPISLKSVQLPSELTQSKSAQSWELVPPDGGWGWLILAGSMLVNILVPGTVKSFGVLFVEFLEVFDATPAAAAWIPALCYFLYSSLGPLSSLLSVKYSYRSVTILGGTFAAAGMILSYWAQSVTYLYISYGLLVGSGAGLSFPPTVYIVTSYFVRLRGLANGLCISGSAIGSIILPPLLRLLLETYGYRGAVLIMGAITLNVWVGAMLYHPVERHMKKVPKRDDHETEAMLQTESEELTDEATTSHKQEFNTLPINSSLSNNFVRSVSSATVQHYQSPDRTRKISMPVGKENSQGRPMNNGRPMDSLDLLSHSRLPASRLSQHRTPHRSPSTSSFNYISTPYHGSTLSALHPEQFASSLTLKSLSLNPVTSCCKDSKTSKDATPKERNKFFDVSLLKDPIYLVILISNSTNAISYTNFIILLPSYAIMENYDKSMAAYLISIVSALDLVGRIGGSALSDLGWIPKQWYFIGGLFVSGIALVLLPSATDYIILSVYCGIFGLASGIYVGVTAVIMADMLGTERLTSTYGISLFVNGVLQLIGPPLCGLWFEKTGAYGKLFSTLGIVLIAGASIWGFVPFIKKRRHSRENSTSTE